MATFPPLHTHTHTPPNSLIYGGTVQKSEKGPNESYLKREIESYGKKVK